MFAIRARFACWWVLGKRTWVVNQLFISFIGHQTRRMVSSDISWTVAMARKCVNFALTTNLYYSRDILISVKPLTYSWFSKFTFFRYLSIEIELMFLMNFFSYNLAIYIYSIFQHYRCESTNVMTLWDGLEIKFVIEPAVILKNSFIIRSIILLLITFNAWSIDQSTEH